MKITILAPGKIREAWLRDGCQEFIKRLSRYAELELPELQDAPDSLPLEEALAREAREIRRRLPERAFVVALDLGGEKLDSPALAAKMDEWMERGQSRVVFIIGGSRGLEASLLREAHAKFSLSPLTFTHGMSRLLLLEQCYRAFRILRGEPYHK